MGIGLNGAASLQHSVDLMAYMGSKNKEGEKSPSGDYAKQANADTMDFLSDNSEFFTHSPEKIEQALNITNKNIQGKLKMDEAIKMRFESLKRNSPEYEKLSNFSEKQTQASRDKLRKDLINLFNEEDKGGN